MHITREWAVRARILLAQGRAALPGRAGRQRLAGFADSVRAAFPDLSEREAHALHARYRASMRKFALMKDFLASLSADQLGAFLDRHVQVEGRETLDMLRQSAEPVIFVTPHYGSFPAACLKLIREIGHEKTINAFYNPPSANRSSEGFETLFSRLGYGFHALFNDDTAVLKALRVLKRGEALTMMPDVFDINGHVLYVPFFGKLVPAMAGTALFALKSRATVIVGYGCPGQGIDSTLKLGQPLRIERSDSLENDIATLTAAIFQEMEAQIRRHPEHWIYIKDIGTLLAGRLPVDARDDEKWLAGMEAASGQFDAFLPEWRFVLREMRAMQHDVPQEVANA